MFLPVDPGSGLPIYRQVMDQVKRMVAAGSLKAGQKVPSVRDLAATLQINPLTVGKAYGEMEREGVLEARRGLGMFVAEGASVASRAARKEGARQAADRLALEAHQAGLDLDRTQQLLAESWKKVEEGRNR